MSNKVTVMDKTHEIFSIDGTGNRVKVGQANVRMYEGETTFRNSVTSEFETEEKLYKPTKTEWLPLDHYDALEPLFDAGWTLTRHHIARGGLSGHFTFTNPNWDPYNDPFTWDRDIFTEAGRRSGLLDMIEVNGNIRPGGNHRYRRGLYRLACTNGLTVEELGLGDIRMNALNWSMDKLHEEILNAPRLDPEKLRGDKVATAKGAKRFFDFIEDFALNPEPTNDLPKFAKKLIQPLETIPQWTLFNAVNQFYALSQSNTPVHSMDVANAWTGAINMPTEDGDERGTMGVLRKVDALTRSTSDLMGVYSM